jgi:ABC-type Fe3+ transport system substrate-binding protein
VTRLGIFAVFVAALAGDAAFAQGWEEAWKKTIAEAEKEGTVLLNLPASNTQREFLTAEWPKAFPKIRLIQDAGADGTSLPKIRLERSTGKFLHDIALTGSITAFTLKNEKIADPIIPEFILPDVKDPKTWGGWEKVFYDNEHQYVFEPQIFLKMPFYNAKLLSPEKVKQMGAKIMLEPELKGKIVWHDPLIPGSGETFAPVLRKLLGDDGLKKLVQEQVVFTANMMDMVDKMARGTFTIGMGPVMTQLLERYRKAGLDLDIRPLGNRPEYAAFANTGGANTVIFNNRPHPNATKVFLNWFASKDISTRLAKAMGQDSSRVDVPPQVHPEEARLQGVAYDEPTRERNTEVVKASHELIRGFRRMN